MRLGRDLEAYVAKRFCEDTGFKVRRSHKLYQHEEYPFMQSIENALLIVDRLLAGHGEDGSEAARNFINRYFRDSRESVSLPLEDGLTEKLKKRQELQESIDRLTAEKNKIEQEVKLYLGEALVLHMKDVIGYRIMDYYQRRYREKKEV